MSYLGEAIDKITAQQPPEENAVWMVGEQLKDILRGDPWLSELVLQDLDVKAMSLAECEKKIRAYADAHKQGSVAVVPGSVADRIIREFYGLPKKGETAPAPAGGVMLNLADFAGGGAR